MKIGILIPTRGDRPEFLKFALQQIERQTEKPHKIIIVDDAPKDSKPDITYRYRIGCERLQEDGCDLFIFWEDDDWYSKDYLRKMRLFWLIHNKPDLIGLDSTIYYNIITNKYIFLNHPGRASMMSMAVSPAINKMKWCDDNYSFCDMHLWKNIKIKKTIHLNNPICIGIKHGIGLCGGGGHVKEWKQYQLVDENFNMLSTIIDPISLKFYKQIHEKQI